MWKNGDTARGSTLYSIDKPPCEERLRIRNILDPIDLSSKLELKNESETAFAPNRMTKLDAKR